METRNSIDYSLAHILYIVVSANKMSNHDSNNFFPIHIGLSLQILHAYSDNNSILMPRCSDIQNG